MADNILQATDIGKSFYIPERISILKKISLEVNQGDTIAITGRSGQGKSTLLQILGTLEPACQGSLSIAGQIINHFNKSAIRRKHLAFIFQSFHLLEDYTTLENVLMPAKISRQSISKGSPAHKQALELLEEVCLADRANFHSKLLSGGEKQRVAIARALSNDPSIIFADEPSGNLDQETSIAIHSLLMNFVQKKNKALIVVTHNAELAAMCKIQYDLHDGQLNLVRHNIANI
ncbi:MAG: ABC transporter ATP-binding protein [Parachlamydiaceae bacterium]|nr:ABC transporter ATP-binding protein [Parachlamydiaceae bacterium]